MASSVSFPVFGQDAILPKDVSDPPRAAALPGDMRPSQPAGFMVGNSAAMRDVFNRIRKFATYDLSVLITGESGTGKELAARALQERSGRANGPFVAINCAGVPETLIASELFGHEKGAFTGAHARKRGQIELAHGGTLLLDEIGDMPINLQAHLLRFLQEGEIVRVGGHETIKVDVRVIAATNVCPKAAIAAGRMREDLFYRLNVLNIHLPPLRQRAEDIPVLVSYFLGTIARELGCEAPGISDAAGAILAQHDWPGNIRELIATLRRAVVLCEGGQIQAADLGIERMKPNTAKVPKSFGGRPTPGSDEERAMLVASLQQHGANVTRCAAAIQVSRVTFYKMLGRNGIELRQDHDKALPLSVVGKYSPGDA